MPDHVDSEQMFQRLELMVTCIGADEGLVDARKRFIGFMRELLHLTPTGEPDHLEYYDDSASESDSCLEGRAW